MTSSQLQEYARFGALVRLRAIEVERNAIMRAFPHLDKASGRSNGASPPINGGRKGMSASQRRAVGERMKAYWAKRRGEKAGTEGAHTHTPSDPRQTPAQRPSNRKGMSPSARKVQGERMRAFWAARRAEKSAASDGGQAEAGAGSSGKGKHSRKAGRREPRKK